jgi:hypothetical protein
VDAQNLPRVGLCAKKGQRCATEHQHPPEFIPPPLIFPRSYALSSTAIQLNSAYMPRPRPIRRKGKTDFIAKAREKKKTADADINADPTPPLPTVEPPPKRPRPNPQPEPDTDDDDGGCDGFAARGLDVAVSLVPKA